MKDMKREDLINAIIDSPNFKRVSNDINGNPRYVLHYSLFLKDSDEVSGVGEGYGLALSRAKKFGFRPYRGRDFGGGFVGQSYNIRVTLAEILDLIK